MGALLKPKRVLTDTIKPADLRPVFRMRVRPLPDVDTIRALRELLKRMQRQFGFQCLECVEEGGDKVPFEQDPR